MTVIIDLGPEIEAALTTLAAEQGVSPAQYVRLLVEERIPGHGRTTLSPAQRAADWRESAKRLPSTKLLSDEAISRESIYDARG